MTFILPLTVALLCLDYQDLSFHTQSFCTLQLIISAIFDGRSDERLVDIYFGTPGKDGWNLSYKYLITAAQTESFGNRQYFHS